MRRDDLMRHWQATLLSAALKAWRAPFDESKVRRHPKGSKQGGRFAPKGGIRQGLPGFDEDRERARVDELVDEIYYDLDTVDRDFIEWLISAWIMDDPGYAGTAIQKAAAVEFGGDLSRVEGADAIADVSDARAILRWLYDHSDRRPMTVYRGTSGREGRPLESWTEDRAVAAFYARRNGGRVIARDVRADEILTTWRSGFGLESAKEVIVINRDTGETPADRAAKAWSIDDYRAARRQWDERKIRRHPRGVREGGRFAPKYGGPTTPVQRQPRQSPPIRLTAQDPVPPELVSVDPTPNWWVMTDRPRPKVKGKAAKPWTPSPEAKAAREAVIAIDRDLKKTLDKHMRQVQKVLGKAGDLRGQLESLDETQRKRTRTRIAKLESQAKDLWETMRQDQEAAQRAMHERLAGRKLDMKAPRGRGWHIVTNRATLDDEKRVKRTRDAFYIFTHLVSPNVVGTVKRTVPDLKRSYSFETGYEPAQRYEPYKIALTVGGEGPYGLYWAEEKEHQGADGPRTLTAFLKLPPYAGERDLIHYLGHFLEDTNPYVADLARQFVERRTKDKPLRLMADIHPNRHWPANAYGQAGDFFDPALGAYYGPGPDKKGQLQRDATEVIAVGLEHYIHNPAQLAVKDPELFDLIHDIAHGIVGAMPPLQNVGPDPAHGYPTDDPDAVKPWLMDAAEFQAAAERGKIHKKTGVWTPREDLLHRFVLKPSPLQQGEAAGYSYDDIAAYYAHRAGVWPERMTAQQRKQFEQNALPVKLRWDNARRQMLYDAIHAGHELPEAMLKADRDLRRTYTSLAHERRARARLFEKIKEMEVQPRQTPPIRLTPEDPVPPELAAINVGAVGPDAADWWVMADRPRPKVKAKAAKPWTPSPEAQTARQQLMEIDQQTQTAIDDLMQRAEATMTMASDLRAQSPQLTGEAERKEHADRIGALEDQAVEIWDEMRRVSEDARAKALEMLRITSLDDVWRWANQAAPGWKIVTSQATLDDKRAVQALRTGVTTFLTHVDPRVFATLPAKLSKFQRRSVGETPYVPVETYRPHNLAVTIGEAPHGLHWARERRSEGSDQRDWTAYIKVPAQPGMQRIIHHLGHWLEDSNPYVADLARQFIEKRAQGQPLRPMAEIDPQGQWPADAYGQAGDFFTPALGVYYGPRPGKKGKIKRDATEVIAMGLEHYLEDPIRLARMDPELFDLIYDIAHGHAGAMPPLRQVGPDPAGGYPMDDRKVKKPWLMTLEGFKKAAERGQVHEKTGVLTPREDLLDRFVLDPTPLLRGEMAGYSYDDIAAFYATQAGVWPERLTPKQRQRFEEWGQTIEERWQNAQEALLYDAIASGHTLPESVLDRAPWIRNSYITANPARGLRRRLIARIGEQADAASAETPPRQAAPAAPVDPVSGLRAAGYAQSPTRQGNDDPDAVAEMRRQDEATVAWFAGDRPPDALWMKGYRAQAKVKVVEAALKAMITDLSEMARDPRTVWGYGVEELHADFREWVSEKERTGWIKDKYGRHHKYTSEKVKDRRFPQRPPAPATRYDELDWEDQPDVIATFLREKGLEAPVDPSKLTYEHANDFIRTWHKSSNDHDMRSLGLQKTVSALFGQPLSAWQQERVNEREEARRAALAAQDQGIGVPPRETYIFERPLVDPTVDNGKRYTYSTGEEAQAILRRTLQDLYNRTQAHLAKLPGDTVRLYRGIRLNVTDKEPLRLGEVVDLTENAVESWTVNYDIAAKYAHRRLKGVEPPFFAQGAVVAMDVPKERILATPDTGHGCLNEWEVLVLGGQLSRDEGLLVYVSDVVDETRERGWH